MIPFNINIKIIEKYKMSSLPLKSFCEIEYLDRHQERIHCPLLRDCKQFHLVMRFSEVTIIYFIKNAGVTIWLMDF